MRCWNASRSGAGFIAAPRPERRQHPQALRLYGVEESEYSSEAEMFDLMHAMRCASAPARPSRATALGAILFEMTMDRQIEGMGSAAYLWDVKRVVPFLKVDKGLADEVDGAQVMKPMPDLDALCERRRRRCVRHQDAFGDPARTPPASRPSSRSSSRSAHRSSATAWCRSSSPRSTSTVRRRRRPKTCCSGRSSPTSTSSVPISR
ncbi:MAG: hypothetical protein R2713_24125 [Ilumatobacteraceae bacterium]